MTAQRLAFPAMLTGSAVLAFGPWLVRLADVGPVSAAFWRLSLAIAPLLLLARLVRQPVSRPTRALLVAAALAGVFFAADLALWHLGIRRTTMTNATLMGNSASFLLPVYGFVATRAWPGRMQVVALALALAGVSLLLGRSAELSSRHLAGDLLCVGAGVAYAAYFVAVDRVRAATAPVPLLLLVSIFAALATVPLALVEGSAWPRDWTPLVLLALGSQVVGQGLVIFAVGYLPPLVVGLALLIQPAISGTIGALRFGEVPGPYEITGALLVAAALVLVRLPSRTSASAN